jgi:hypothetical protein
MQAGAVFMQKARDRRYGIAGNFDGAPRISSSVPR